MSKPHAKNEVKFSTQQQWEQKTGTSSPQTEVMQTKLDGGRGRTKGGLVGGCWGLVVFVGCWGGGLVGVVVVGGQNDARPKPLPKSRHDRKKKERGLEDFATSCCLIRRCAGRARKVNDDEIQG